MKLQCKRKDYCIEIINTQSPFLKYVCSFIITDELIRKFYKKTINLCELLSCILKSIDALLKDMREKGIIDKDDDAGTTKQEKYLFSQLVLNATVLELIKIYGDPEK